MSTTKVNNYQIGQSLTATNNATWYQPSTPDGTVRLGRGNAGATTSDIITVNSDGSVTFSGAVSASSFVGAGLVLQAVQTSNFAAVAGRAYPVNTTSGAITVTLPASPTAGQQINVVDYAGTAVTNNITVNPNGLKINGSTSNALVSTSRASVTLIYVDSTQGWLSIGIGNSSYLAQAYAVDYLIVAGGGGGSASHGAGGGAGGLIQATSYSIFPAVSYSVVIGAGGTASGNSASAGGNGNSSSVFGFSAGGGGGASAGYPSAGATGNAGLATNGNGGGAGGGGASQSGGAGSGAGYSGGNNVSNGAAGAGGGGGGAGGAGANATGSGGGSATGGAGGVGVNWQSLGTYYAGGGGGGGWGTTGANGGLGGGGKAGNSGQAGTAGTANTGGGGGGSGDSSNNPGGAGGSGIVIIRYAGAQRATGGTITSSGGYTYHTFTSSGTFTS